MASKCRATKQELLQLELAGFAHDLGVYQLMCVCWISGVSARLALCLFFCLEADD